MKTKHTLVALFVSTICLNLSAAPVSWTGGAAGSWSTAANWSTVSVPAATDDVTIPAGSAVTVSDDAGKINSLIVGGSLTIASSGTLVVNSTTAAVGATVDIAGGQIINDGTLTFKNSVTNTVPVVLFSDNAVADELTNNGTLTLDNMATSTAAYCVLTKQNQSTATFKMGGTLNLNLFAASIFLQTADGTGGKLTLAGNTTIASEMAPLNARFLKLMGPSSVTIDAAAKLVVYAAYSNTTNGFICLQSNNITIGGVLNVDGDFTIHGVASGHSGIYMNAQAATAIATLDIKGMLTIDGTFATAKSCINVAGNAGAINTIKVETSGTLVLSNNDPVQALFSFSSLTIPLSFVNEGTVKLSTAALPVLTAPNQTQTGAGTFIYNSFTALKNVRGMETTVRAFGQYIQISVPASEGAKMTLLDVSGKTIQTAILKDYNNTITTNCRKGIYIVRIKSDKGTYSQKISII